MTTRRRPFQCLSALSPQFSFALFVVGSPGCASLDGLSDRDSKDGGREVDTTPSADASRPADVASDHGTEAGKTHQDGGVLDGAEKDAPPTPDVTVSSFAPIRIVCGQADPVTDVDGNVWSADEYYVGGTTQEGASAIAGTASPMLYYGQRFGDDNAAFNYTIPVGAGSYLVRLLFTEGFYQDNTTTGTRTFSVTINGAPALADFDIYAAAGNQLNTAVDRSFSVELPLASSVTIAFTAGKADAKIDAIELSASVPTDGGSYSYHDRVWSRNSSGAVLLSRQ